MFTYHLIGKLPALVLCVFVLAGVKGHSGELSTKASLSGQTRTLSPSMYGFNMNLLRENTWPDAEWVERLASLTPGLLRYPGGTVSSYWDWRNGSVFPEYADRFGGRQLAVYPLSDFVTGCAEVGAQSIYCLNMFSSTLEEQTAMLEEAERLGQTIRYIEMGNEYYFSQKFGSVFPDGETYGNKAENWINVLKEKWPNARYAVLLKDARNDDHQQWNSGVLSTCTSMDAITFHPYNGAGLGTPPNIDDDTWRQQYEQMKDPRVIENMLVLPWMKLKRIREDDSFPADVAWWLTEYNLFDRGGAPVGSWAHGLYAATMLLGYLDEPRVEMALTHQVAGLRWFAAIHATDGTVPTIPEKPYAKNTLTATGHTMAMLGEVLKPAVSAEKISLSPDLIQTKTIGDTEISWSMVTSWVLRDQNNQASLVFLNQSQNSIEVDVSDLGLGELSGMAAGAEGYEQVLGDGAAPRYSTVQVNDNMHVLAPFSITILKAGADVSTSSIN